MPLNDIKYPYGPRIRLVGNMLNLDFEGSPGPAPPTSSHGNAHLYKQWVDTSVTPPMIRICGVPSASAGYVASEWIPMLAIDAPGNRVVLYGDVVASSSIYLKNPTGAISVGLFYNGPGPLLQMKPTYFWQLNDTSGVLTWNVPGHDPNSPPAALTLNTDGTLVADAGVFVGDTSFGLSRAGIGTPPSGAYKLQLSGQASLYYDPSDTSITLAYINGGLHAAIKYTNHKIAFCGDADLGFDTITVGLKNARFAANSYWQYQISNGVLSWYSLGAYQCKIDTSGNFTARNNLLAHDDPNFGVVQDATSRQLLFGIDKYLRYDLSSSDLQWHTQVTNHLVLRFSDGKTMSNIGPVAGNGAYENFSDIRFKDEKTIEPATQGLDVILGLNPVSFQRKSLLVPDPPERPQELGFIAQEVVTVLPEAVFVAGVELPDGTGGLETADPTLSMTSETIVAVLVNAVKELNARLVALETPGLIQSR